MSQWDWNPTALRPWTVPTELTITALEGATARPCVGTTLERYLLKKTRPVESGPWEGLPQGAGLEKQLRRRGGNHMGCAPDAVVPAESGAWGTKKKGARTILAPFEIMPAATCFPTPFPMQRFVQRSRYALTRRSPPMARHGQRHVDRIAAVQKAGARTILAPFEIMPAATYSPTQFPMQYHRRYQA
jgi:hypothetical protein